MVGSASVRFSKFAYLYDLINHDRDIERESRFIDYVYKYHCSRNSRIIMDAGCGTGSHMRYLLSMGYQLIGVDISRAMLNIAKEKLGIGKYTLICCRDDEVKLENSVDMIISMFSTFNLKIPLKEIRSSLKAYHSYLSPEGVLLIDMIDWRKFAEDFVGKVTLDKFNIKDRDIGHVQNVYPTKTENIFILRKDFFINFTNELKKFEHVVDKFKVKIYDERNVSELLKEHGFRVLKIYHGFREEDKGRLIIVARKA